MMKQLLLSLFLLFCANSMAQDIELKYLKLVNATSANASMRKDINGKTGCLLRLQMKEEGAQFEGNILGDVEYKNGEYNIYMAQGSRRLSIKHANYLPITVVFSTLGTKSLNEGSEYLMTTKLHKEKQKSDSKKKGMAIIQVTPASAQLSVDGEEATSDGGGQYSLNLPYGTHYFSVQYGSFSLSNQAVTIDKQPKAINVDLTEYFAHLNITCNEKDAAIYINDELSGIGECDNLVTPGTYVIQAKKDGFHTLTQTVVATDRDSISVDLKNMTLIAGSLQIDYEPIDAEVILDGKSVGKTPLKLENISIGHHSVEIKKEHCSIARMKCLVEENKTTKLKGQLKMSSWEFLLNKAKQGNDYATFLLGYYSVGERPSIGALSYDMPWIRGNTDTSDQADPIFEGAYILDIPKDGSYEDAIIWYKELADHSKNNDFKIAAMLVLSWYYTKLRLYSKSYRWAKTAYDISKSTKIDEAQIEEVTHALGWHLYHGLGVAKDRNMAYKLYQDGCYGKYRGGSLDDYYTHDEGELDIYLGFFPFI